jgi:hypothetical protein
MISRNIRSKAVLIPVDLDDELLRKTTEIGHIAANRHLPPKVAVIDRDPVAQVPPQLSLGFGERSS